MGMGMHLHAPCHGADPLLPGPLLPLAARPTPAPAPSQDLANGMPGSFDQGLPSGGSSGPQRNGAGTVANAGAAAPTATTTTSGGGTAQELVAAAAPARDEAEDPSDKIASKMLSGWALTDSYCPR